MQLQFAQVEGRPGAWFWKWVCPNSEFYQECGCHLIRNNQIIESVDSICRDNGDTQYITMQIKSKSQLLLLPPPPLFYAIVPTCTLFPCFSWSVILHLVTLLIFFSNNVWLRKTVYKDSDYTVVIAVMHCSKRMKTEFSQVLVATVSPGGDEVVSAVIFFFSSFWPPLLARLEQHGCHM